MVKPKNITDSSGWTWIFRNNKKTVKKQIAYPFYKEVKKLATSFYVSNIPNSVDANGLWKICASHGRLVDTFVSNKLSKGVLDDQDLINVEDPSMVLLVKLKDVNSMSNMYVICRNEGFTELKIHHVGGLWIWIQFPSSSSADNFQTNASLKSIYSCIKTATHSFKVDEQRVLVEVHGVNYDVHVHELGTRNINIVDETLDSSDNLDVNGMKKAEDYVDKNTLADLNDFNDLKETINELASNEIEHPISKENTDQENDINKVSLEIAVSSNLSRPLGFEHMKRTLITLQIYIKYP
ncbi:hypothetical protein Tco_1097555 [Tanacetum coccineum]